MAPQIQFLDQDIDIAPPNGYREPLPVTIGPSAISNDMRLAFISASGTAGGTSLEMAMTPDPMTGFTAAYSLAPGFETHGVYYQRISSGSIDTSVAWPRPSGWLHFMFGLMTARNVHPTTAPTAGWLRLNQTAGDSVAVTESVAVPGPGAMLLMAGTVQNPYVAQGAPSWPVAMGAPTGWDNVVATDKSGQTFYPYDNNPSLIFVAKSFTTAGSTGALSFPTAIGAPAFCGLWAWLPAISDVPITLGAV